MKLATNAAENDAIRRRGMTVLELLTTMGIISTLVTLVLPAVNSARESARKSQCVNQLKQIGIALYAYHELWSVLPPGLQHNTTKQSAYGWAVPLLPGLEQRSAYQLVDRRLAVAHPVNAAARNTPIAQLICPSDLLDRNFVLFTDSQITGSIQPLFSLPTASYVGVFGTLEADDSIPAPLGEGVFLESRAVRFAEVRRGLSQTLFVGERTMARVPSTWLGIDFRGEDAACRILGTAATAPNCGKCDECEFDSRHPGGANFLMGDGRVQMLADNIDSNLYRRLARRSEP